MPSSLTYPGVYIEEIPSGVRTITGVATSITAFVGRALRGPVDKPVTINSYGDFESKFGGLWVESTLGYAVRDFYLNGGSQAIIVRLYHDDVEEEEDPETETTALASPSKAMLDANGLELEAAYAGKWGNALRVRIDHEVSEDVATRYNLQTGGNLQIEDLFNLTVRDMKTGAIEQFRNLTVVDSPRRVDKVLESESSLIRVLDPTALPEAIPTAHGDPPDRKSVWDDDASSSPVPDESKVTVELPLTADDFTGEGKSAANEGLFALRKVDLFNLLCLPPYTDDAADSARLVDEAAILCQEQRAFLIVDPPSAWRTKDDARDGKDAIGTSSNHAAVFFPNLRKPNPLRDNQMEDFAPCGAVAGIFARTDAQRGIWKAPAGLDATLAGVPDLSVVLNDAENGELNPLGINCLRAFPAAGRVVWGARTLQGDDRLASEWKYIPVRRTALYIEESLYRGTQWVVFEPNDEPLWSQIRLNVGAFMQNLFRQGAFQGKTPQEAYFVKCDKETTTQTDINLGIVNVVVGFAPLKPAEFVVIKLQQMAGQIAV
jgi:uncharacterized protein